jgi:hypothetical protein
VRGLTENRTCDLDRIREEDDIDLLVSDVGDPGYTACLVRPGKDLPCGIILAPGQSRGRERFSVAHELGHYYIPTHQSRPMGWCGEDDMMARADSGRRFEWEANDFAAELLMPRRSFLCDARSKDPGFHEVITLAAPDMYDVSITAAALRYVELSREACALICARAGIIEWVAKSEAFFYRIPWRGTALPPGSHAQLVFNGESPQEKPEAQDPYTWLEVEQKTTPELFESTLAIPSQDQVLSLLWVIPREVDGDSGW